MKKVSPEDDGVFRRVHGVNPSGGDEEGVAGLHLDPRTVFNHVAEKCLALFGKFLNFVNVNQLLYSVIT